MSQVTETLGTLLERYVLVMEEYGMITVEADPEWPSPCEVGTPDEEGMIAWKPTAMTVPPDFSDMEAAIGETLHPDIKAFYGSYWAGEVQAGYEDETVLLRTVWNPKDLARTKAALIDHALARREALSGSATIFVANTNSDLFFSVDNVTGEVLLEEPGNPPQGVSAPSLSHFLADLSFGEE